MHLASVEERREEKYSFPRVIGGAGSYYHYYSLRLFRDTFFAKRPLLAKFIKKVFPPYVPVRKSLFFYRTNKSEPYYSVLFRPWWWYLPSPSVPLYFILLMHFTSPDPLFHLSTQFLCCCYLPHPFQMIRKATFSSKWEAVNSPSFLFSPANSPFTYLTSSNFPPSPPNENFLNRKAATGANRRPPKGDGFWNLTSGGFSLPPLTLVQD